MQKVANATSEFITRYSGPSFGLFCKKSKTTVVALEQLQIGQLPKVCKFIVVCILLYHSVERGFG